jgi:hypothetical protein
MSVAKMTKKQLSDKIEIISLMHIESNHDTGSVWQQKHALLVNQYIESYPNSTLSNDDTAALIFALNTDLQVRDYAMGLLKATDNYYMAWYSLMNRAPKGYKSAQACLASNVRYEQKLKADAIMLLVNADKEYPLAKLLTRVYAAGWAPESFADMRAELHPKVMAGIFNFDKETQ